MNLDFWIFENLERELLKNESGFLDFWKLGTEFLKNESGFFWIFRDFEWEFLKNESGFSSGDARGKKCGSTNFVPIDTLRYPLCLIYNVKAKVELR